MVSKSRTCTYESCRAAVKQLLIQNNLTFKFLLTVLFSDMMEMMMMQNAQMHHMVMQQLMVSSLPGANRSRSPVPPHQHLPVIAGPPTATLAAAEPMLAAVYNHRQSHPSLLNHPPSHVLSGRLTPYS